LDIKIICLLPKIKTAQTSLKSLTTKWLITKNIVDGDFVD